MASTLLDNENPVALISIPDSGQWVLPDAPLTEKKDLALYMKQRTFLIATASGSGTGFFINADGVALTNWHVLQPSDIGSAFAGLYEDNPTGSDIQKKRRIKDVLWCEDITGLDISVIKVELEDGEKMPYFNIAKRRPNQGDEVSTFGNPFEHTASYAKGVISTFRTDPYAQRNVDMVQYDIATNPGNSGGPVSDKYGQVVAVVDVKDARGNGIGYGIDVMQLRPILDRLGVKYGGK